MSNKLKLVALVILILAAIALMVYRNQEAKNEVSEKSAGQSSNSAQGQNGSGAPGSEDFSDADLLDDEEFQDFNVKCENGEWVQVADVQGEAVFLSGKMRKVYAGEDVPAEVKGFSYYVESQSSAALSGSDLSKLDMFEDRSVEVRGPKSQDGKSVIVSAVRCGGAETNKQIIDSRMKIMNWLAANINAAVSKKAPSEKWVIDSAEFVDEKYVYIEFYDVAEDSDSYDGEDTSRQALLEMSAKSDGSWSAKELAWWEMGEEEYVLKSGSDKFGNVMDTYLYQYDQEEKSWTRI
jgi:hypothetical protein